MTREEEEELAELSKRFRENMGRIDEAILSQLRRGRPQALIARDFGLTHSSISQRATKHNIHYYAKKS